MQQEFSTVAARTYKGFAVSRPNAPPALPAPVGGCSGSGGLPARAPAPPRKSARSEVVAGIVAAALLGAGLGYGVAFVSPGAGKAEAPTAPSPDVGQLAAQTVPPSPADDMLSAPLPAPSVADPAQPPPTASGLAEAEEEAGPDEPRIARPARTRAHAASARRRRTPRAATVVATTGRPRSDCDLEAGATDCRRDKATLSRRLDLAFAKAFPSGAAPPSELEPPY
jgi:hypothetical protein